MMWDLAGCRVDSPTVERLTSWLSDELGRDIDVFDLFFPPSSHHPEADLLTETALLVCNGCPIQFDCADWAVRTHQFDGIHGGMRRPEKIVRARQLGIRIRRERMLFDEEEAA